MRYVFKPGKNEVAVHIHIHEKDDVVVYGKLVEEPHEVT